MRSHIAACQPAWPLLSTGDATINPENFGKAVTRIGREKFSAGRLAAKVASDFVADRPGTASFDKGRASLRQFLTSPVIRNAAAMFPTLCDNAKSPEDWRQNDRPRKMIFGFKSENIAPLGQEIRDGRPVPGSQ